MSKPNRIRLPRVRATPQRTRSLTVAIVGAGRLGAALGIGLVASGVTVVAAVCRRADHARAAARLIGNNVVPLGAAHLSKVPESDIVLLATPDDAIVPTAASLGRIARPPGQIVLHASGSRPSTILRSVLPPDVAIGSMHPLLAISDPLSGAVGLRSAVFSVEGELRAVKAARKLVDALGAQVVPIKTEQKALYHAAAVLAAGHVVALFDLATRMMERCGPDRKTSTRMLVTLFQSATENLGQKEPAAMMTGPFARGDVDTIENHLLALDSKELQHALSVYMSLGAHAITVAEEAGLDRATARRIQKILNERPQRDR